MENQEQVWNNIAKEWDKFKKEPGRGVEEFLKSQKGKILDLGSGAGRNLLKIKNCEMYLVDFSEQMLKLAEKKAKEKNIKTHFQTADLTKLPFGNNFFDAAIAIASFHCLPKKSHKKAVKELFRVLKPKAKAKIAVWNKDSKRFKNAPKEKFVRWTDKGLRYYYLFDENEIYDLFKKAGFKIKQKLESGINIDFIVEKPQYNNSFKPQF